MQADAIDEIVAILAAQHKSWPRAGGWAPSNASALLEVARLDRQLSFAHTLRDNFVPFPKESADARQILGYVNLRSLCEGARYNYLLPCITTIILQTKSRLLDAIERKT
jgi:hypothetical protein